MRVKQIALIFGLSFLLVAGNITNKAMAQDEGDPAMRTVAFASLGGGAAGAFLGIAIWLLDPLNPNADLTNSAMQGFAVGAIGGSILGTLQLQRQMVLPYRNDYIAPEPNEFEGDVRLQSFGEEHKFAQIPRFQPQRRIPLARIQFKF